MIYANDNDNSACEWLKQLPLAIDHVDSRSIAIVKGSDVKDYTQCHWFAGIGGWPYALQLAQWPIGIPVWSGSCPCQPFSNAGKRKGAKDTEKALWPEFRRLIAECRPPVIFGEQVASKLGREWFAGVRVDLEALGYAVGAADLCAAGVGAPHIRQRLFWVAYNPKSRLERLIAQPEGSQQQTIERSGDAGGVVHSCNRRQAVEEQREGTGGSSSSGGVVNTNSIDTRNDSRRRKESSRRRQITGIGCSEAIRLEHAESDRREQGQQDTTRSNERNAEKGENGRSSVRRTAGGFWSEADYLYCSDGKYRPVEPGSFPLAHGIPNRVAKLRGLGNAIVPQVAAVFVRSFIESIAELQGRPSCQSTTSNP